MNRYQPSTDLLISNSFFIWFQIIILFLTGITLISDIQNFIFHTTPWTVPKTDELMIYALAMLMCALIPLLSKSILVLANHEFTYYKIYFLLLCPVSVVLYWMLSEKLRYLYVYILTLIGLCVFYADAKGFKLKKPVFFNQYFDKCLIASMTFCVFFIVWRCQDNHFSLFFKWILPVFLLFFSILRFANFYSRYLLFFVPIFLFIVTFFSSAGYNNSHYNFILGPVIEILYGHAHPLSIDNQYGGGLTAFLALYFKLKGNISIEGFQTLLHFLTFIQYLLVYFICVTLYHSHRIALLTLLAILFFGFYSLGDGYYATPSTGFLRFGFIYLILLSYMLEDKLYSKEVGYFITAIIGSLSIIFSFEIAIYTIPALFFAEYMSGNIRLFLPIFIGCIIVTAAIYLSPFILQAKWPLLWHYYEYPLLYAAGFGQIPLNRLISFWWLFPLLYGFFLIRIVSGNISNKIIIALVVYGMALFTYYGGRAHPNNIFHISIPFIILSVYLVINLKSLSLFARQILLTFTFIVFIAVQSEWIYVGDPVIQGIWIRNIPLAINSLTPYKLPIKVGGLTETPRHTHDCSYYLALMPYVKNNAIALLSADNDFIDFYACSHTHNALHINPYYEIAINPKAVNRMITNAGRGYNKYFLVDADLLKQKFDKANSMMTWKILDKIQAKPVGIVKLPNITLRLFETGDKFANLH